MRKEARTGNSKFGVAINCDEESVGGTGLGRS